MVEHTCYKCNKSFTRKSNYEYHLTKKIPCAPTVTRMDELEKRNVILEQQMKELERKMEHLLKINTGNIMNTTNNNIIEESNKVLIQ